MFSISLSDKAWSPYAAGVIIGLLQIPAFLLVDTALGASSSFAAAAGYLAALFDPGVAEKGSYFAKYMAGSKYAWQSALVIGIALGAFLSMRASGARRQAFSPIWTRAAGIRSLGPRILMGFAGGFLLVLGARIAGGCTSGHGISGMAQLVPGSMLAVAGMFIGGILFANLVYRRI